MKMKSFRELSDNKKPNAQLDLIGQRNKPERFKYSVECEGPLKTCSESAKLLKAYGIKLHGSLEIKIEELVPDIASYNSVWQISRFASEDFGSLSNYLFEILEKIFNHASRCSIYLAERNEEGGRQRVILSHYLTISMNGGVKTESMDKKEPIVNSKDPALKAYLEKKPRFIHYKDGIDLIFKNLNIDSHAGDLYVIEKNVLKDDLAIVPFYYREKNRPFGVLILEGDLRCKGSTKNGFGKVFYSAKTVAGLSAQLGFISMQKYDSTTSFHRKKDFEIDLKSSIRSIIKEQSKGIRKNIFLLLIDLDNFKSINEQYGYIAGDNLLSSVAKVIENSVRRPEYGRKQDTIARWGGEEFVVILEDVTRENAINIAKRINEGVRKASVSVEKEKEIKKISVTCSIGLLNISDLLPLVFDNRSIDGLAKYVFTKCDVLIKSVKRNGKDGIAFFSENGKVEIVK